MSGVIEPDASALAELTSAVLELRATVARHDEALTQMGHLARLLRIIGNGLADVADETERRLQGLVPPETDR